MQSKQFPHKPRLVQKQATSVFSTCYPSQPRPVH